MSSVCAGIGAFGWADGSIRRILFISGLALMSWTAWALLTFAIGTKLMPDPQTRSNVGELLRTIGFASAPGILRVFGVVPGATIPAFAITAIWMLCAMVVAVRQALDYTRHRARHRGLRHRVGARDSGYRLVIFGCSSVRPLS